MDSASIARSVSTAVCGGKRSMGSQKLPMSLRDPRAKERQGSPAAFGRVPTISAPVTARSAMLHMKTALAFVGAQEAALPASVDAAGRESAGLGQVASDSGPSRLALRRTARGPGICSEEGDGVDEVATAGMHDEIAAAALCDVVEPARFVDAEDGSGLSPATKVVRVPAVAETFGKGFERQVS